MVEHKIRKECAYCKREFYVFPSLNRLKCCSISCSKKLAWKNNKYKLGKNHFKKGSKPWNKNLKGFNKGHKPTYRGGNHHSHSKESKRKISIAKKGNSPAWNKGLKGFNSGEKNNLWKGGVTPLNYKIRNSLEYKQWRMQVFLRDNFTCQFCNKRGGEMNAHHIKPFYKFPELRFELNNGVTLCKGCHDLTKNERWSKL